jgi:hypothetical protein
MYMRCSGIPLWNETTYYKIQPGMYVGTFIYVLDRP